MYFQLLKGIHSEGGKKYQVMIKRDDKGQVIDMKCPIIETDKDLVKAFGANKFRKMSKNEAALFLGEELNVVGQQEATSPDPTALSKSEVAKAVEKGAVGILEPPGVEVTHKFPEIAEFDVKVYFKRGIGYFIEDDGRIVTEVPIKRNNLVSWVQSYREG